MQYNLCCISEELKDGGLNFQTMTWKRFTLLRKQFGEHIALEQLGNRWLNNLNVTIATIRHCAKNCWGYRMSSNMFPLLTHPDFCYKFHDVPQAQTMDRMFLDVSTNNAWRVRLSMHPDQFNVLASDNESSVNRTIRELNYHGWIMDKMGCQKNHWNPINIHVNCSRGNPNEIAKRFYKNFDRCDNSVKTRLVIENEDKGLWNVENLLLHFRGNLKTRLQLPITFDILHHKCNPSPNLTTDFGEDMAIELCDKTWDTRPIFHYSESHPMNKNQRFHADDPSDLPPPIPVDWDVELKNKDKAIRMLYCIELTREAEKMGLYD
jgi:UV DNA damage endonuclease